MNAWRSAHQLPLVPEPPAPTAPKPAPEAANQITAVSWAQDSAAPEAAFQEALAALRRQPLTAQALVDFLARFAARPQSGVRGLQLLARRDGMHPGVTLTVRLIASETPYRPDTEEFLWSIDWLGALRQRDLSERGDTSRFGDELETRIWPMVRARFDHVLAAPPDQPFVIRFSMKITGGRPKQR